MVGLGQYNCYEIKGCACLILFHQLFKNKISLSQEELKYTTKITLLSNSSAANLASIKPKMT